MTMSTDVLTVMMSLDGTLDGSGEEAMASS
jgi:hypothetical protein